jgi:endonuclease YncB( thermonuclease family)
MTRRVERQHRGPVLWLAGAMVTFGSCPVDATCAFEELKQGHVAEIIDARTLKLTDGQEVRLAGLEFPGAAPGARKNGAALAQLVLDHEVTLRGPNAKPDRYGRLVALVFAGGTTNSIQNLLLDQGAAVFSGDVADSDNKGCAMELLAHESTARRARRGLWADAAAIKNTESADDILPWIGQFVVAEGKIASVREAGGTTYVNFSRRWTEGLAITVSRRIIRRFDAWGIALKSLENRTVRVRGFVEQRTGPRIEALGPGQIELVGDSR